MRAQRVYTLPNCTLGVMGLVNDQDIMHILTGFELHFFHDPRRIKGSREVLELILKTVNLYSLAFQKGQEQITPISDMVILEAENPDTHKLTVKSIDPEAEVPEPEPIQVILNTVQLFDLMDSLDRLCTDDLTLPDLTLNLSAPVQFRQEQSWGWGSALAGLGVVLVAIAGLSFMPVPVPEKTPAPERPVPTLPR